MESEIKINEKHLKLLPKKEETTKQPRKAVVIQMEKPKEKVERITYPTEWYDILVSDCKAIITNAQIETGIRLLEAKYVVGKRILKDYQKFGREEYGNKTQENLASDLGTSQPRISEMINFAEKIKKEHNGSFKEFIDGVDTFSWRKVVREWLPKSRRKYENEIQVVLSKEDIGKIEKELNVFQGDFRDKGKAIPENSINLILTDPPYGAPYLELWKPLGELASRVLVEGGFLVSYSGNLYLPQVLDALSQSLEYYWMLALKLKERNLATTRSIFNIWKPILIFYKPPLKLKSEYFVDFIEGHGAEKDKHKWQQAEAEIYPLIEYFCPKEGVILDPMAGSGTTLAAAKKLGRHFIGIELEQENLAVIKERLEK